VHSIFNIVHSIPGGAVFLGVTSGAGETSITLLTKVSGGREVASRRRDTRARKVFFTIVPRAVVG
jgi:hypothetical protein